MTNCPICDAEIVEGVEFCPSCRSYLGWSQADDGEPAEAPVARRPDEQVEPRTPDVSILAEPSVIEVAPGGTAAVRVTINNHTDSDDTYELAIRQDLPLRTSVEPSEAIRVAANDSAGAVLTIEFPGHLEIGESTRISVRVSSTSNPDTSAAQFIQIRPAGGGAVLSATEVRRTGLKSATFEARMRNNGNRAVMWTPMGSASDDIDLAVAPSPVEIPPGGSVQLTVVATADRLNWGSPREHKITIGGPPDVVENRLDLVYSQSSIVWPAVAGVVVLVVALVLLIGALDSGPSPVTTIAAPSTTVTTSPPTTEPEATTTTAAPTTTVADTAPEGDLGIPGEEMVVPGCDDVYITVLFSAIEPDAYQEQVAANLEAYPGSSYLRTDQSCPSLRQELDGNPIYAVFFGPFETADEACDNLADESSYVRLLSETTPSEEATVDCG